MIQIVQTFVDQYVVRKKHDLNTHDTLVLTSLLVLSTLEQNLNHAQRPRSPKWGHVLLARVGLCARVPLQMRCTQNWCMLDVELKMNEHVQCLVSVSLRKIHLKT